MRRLPNRLLLALTLIAGGALASRLAWQRAQRRRMLARGALQPLNSRWYEVDGLRLHVRQSTAAQGEGRLPVVLVHGLGVSSAYHLPSAERLACGFTVFAPDLPGHGRSEAAESPLGIIDMANVLARWMEAAGLARAMLVGHSMGCQIVAEMAARHPERVERVVLIGPTLAPGLKSTLRLVPRFLMGGASEHPALLWHLLSDYLRMGWRLVPEYRAMLRHRLERPLPQLSMPALVVRGQYDPLVPQHWAEQIARTGGNKDVAVIRGWGHAVQFSAPEQLVASILPFLDRDCGLAAKPPPAAPPAAPQMKRPAMRGVEAGGQA